MRRRRNHSRQASDARPRPARLTSRRPTVMRGRTAGSTAICTFSRRPNPIDTIAVVWFSAFVRRAPRIISVPCGGLSWRRDRLPEDDDALSAKSAGIESRADSGRRGCTASSQLGASSPSGPPRDDGFVRSHCFKPGHRRDVPSKSNGVGPWTHGEFRRLSPQ